MSSGIKIELSRTTQHHLDDFVWYPGPNELIARERFYKELWPALITVIGKSRSVLYIYTDTLQDVRLVLYKASVKEGQRANGKDMPKMYFDYGV